ncbi:MAG: hypothetical protein WC657_06590 [Candidatus Paceibacterota bacterium]|jgi:hypothetical protein
MRKSKDPYWESSFIVVSPEEYERMYEECTPLWKKMWNKCFIRRFWWRHWGCKPFLFYTQNRE